jgi:cytochrome bd-type quinol oxidase subunit 2
MQTTFWLVVLGLFMAGYLALEGADFGVGMLLPLFGRGDQQGRDVLVRAIAPLFLGNEVWLVAAIGVLEGVFPRLDSALLPGLYPVLVPILIAWLIRDAGLWFRSHGTATWRWRWDCATALASALLAGGWGIILADLALADTSLVRTGTTGVFGLVPVLCGILLAGFCVLHGAMFLSRRLSGHPAATVRRAARTLAPLVAAAVLLAGAAVIMTTPPGHHWPLWLLGSLLLAATVSVLFATRSQPAIHPAPPVGQKNPNSTAHRAEPGRAAPAAPQLNPRPSPDHSHPASDSALGRAGSPSAASPPDRRSTVGYVDSEAAIARPDPDSAVEGFAARPPEVTGGRPAARSTIGRFIGRRAGASPGPQSRAPGATGRLRHLSTVALLLTSLALAAAVPLAVLPGFPYLPTGLSVAAASGSATLGELTPLLLAVSPVMIACQVALWWLARGPVEARSWSYF